jgi:hypothetical protein
MRLLTIDQRSKQKTIDAEVSSKDPTNLRKHSDLRAIAQNHQ